jgi:hypothetical protein
LTLVPAAQAPAQKQAGCSHGAPALVTGLGVRSYFVT